MAFTDKNPIKKSVISKRETFFASYFPSQNWSLPDSIIYYITKNPKNASIYQKLIQSCKYFFIKNQILIIDYLNLDYENTKWIVNFKNPQKRVELNNISSKFWVTEKFQSVIYGKTSFTFLISHFYKIDAKELYLRDQVISYNEFLFISSNVENINLFHSTVIDENGTIVPLEILVNSLPKIKSIEFTDIPSTSSITSNTAKKFLEISHFSKIDSFGLSNIPESFDIETFFTYLKKNHHTNFFLHFHDSVSETYKKCLGIIADEISETKSNEYKSPYIDFDGLDNESFF